MESRFCTFLLAQNMDCIKSDPKFACHHSKCSMFSQKTQVICIEVLSIEILNKNYFSFSFFVLNTTQQHLLIKILSTSSSFIYNTSEYAPRSIQNQFKIFLSADFCQGSGMLSQNSFKLSMNLKEASQKRRTTSVWQLAR